MSPWIRYDDGFHDDVRVMEVPNLAAMGLFLACASGTPARSFSMAGAAIRRAPEGLSDFRP